MLSRTILEIPGGRRLLIVQDICQHELLLPLLGATDPTRTVVWRYGEPVGAQRFLAQAHALAATLPDAPAAVNLCEDRFAFLVAFCALALRGQINLLPCSRAPQAVDEVMATWPGCYALGEQALDPAPRGQRQLPPLDGPAARAPRLGWPSIPAARVVAIGYTSGSTGKPSAHAKTWGNFHASNAGNLSMLRATLGERFEVVATVPPQHMYGLEMSVLLPLLANVGVHAGRPFFPADVAAALAGVPAPPVAGMLAATAPWPVELAQAAECRFGAPVLEVFGSTETCVFASRRPTRDDDWSLYDGASLHPQPDGTAVEAPQLDRPAILADIVSLSHHGRHFRLRGRHADLLEIAGKRASLGDLNRRLLAVPGVRDGVVFQLEGGDALGVHRIAALAVAPGLDEHVILEALRRAIDPLFLPRPLKLVDALPRNETGKLPRAALLERLHRHG